MRTLRLTAPLLLSLGGCSLLANPDSIPRPDAGLCQPSCVGVPCGQSDGCGGVCTFGSSCTCTPTCEGVRCGMSDSCGGLCVAASSTCTCTPLCAGKACGAPDECRGVCAVGSGCTCTPQCASVPCGFDDGCGTACMPGSGCTAARNSLRELRVEVLASAFGAPPDGGTPDDDGGVLPPSTHTATLHSGGAAGTGISGSNYRLEKLEVTP